MWNGPIECLLFSFDPVVLDINILLDLFFFSDPQVPALCSGLEAGALSFQSTPEMREELRRVLDYPYLQPLMAFDGLTPDEVLAAFDAQVTLSLEAPKAPFTSLHGAAPAHTGRGYRTQLRVQQAAHLRRFTAAVRAAPTTPAAACPELLAARPAPGPAKA